MKAKSIGLAMLTALALAMPAAAQQRSQPRQEGQRGHEQRQAHAQPRQVAPREGQRAQNARGIDNRGANERDNDNRERERREGPRVAPYRPYYYARPYYAFRPRYELGFGLWLGYPVPYPYYGAYAYPGPYADEYPPPPPDAIEVESGAPYGGLSFDVTPPTAEVYIDGEDAGEVDDFTANAQPLTVGAGSHHIEIDAPGYRPMAFDVDVEPGQVIPFRGDLQPY